MIQKVSGLERCVEVSVHLLSSGVSTLIYFWFFLDINHIQVSYYMNSWYDFAHYSVSQVIDEGT